MCVGYVSTPQLYWYACVCVFDENEYVNQKQMFNNQIDLPIDFCMKGCTYRTYFTYIVI